jgi:ATP-dependent DNA helicase RecG
VVKSTDNEDLKAEYIANRSFDDQHFKDMIIEYLRKFGETKRSSIDSLIIPKLSSVLNSKQKKEKVGNLLSALRKESKIKTVAYGTWELI